MASIKEAKHNGQTVYEAVYTKREAAVLLASLWASLRALEAAPPTALDPLRTNKVELLREIQVLAGELESARDRAETWRYPR